MILIELERKGWRVIEEDATHNNNLLILQNFPTQCVFGNLQNEQYFIQCRSELLALFKEPYYISQYIHTKYPDLNFQDTCFIHVRLGDRLQQKDKCLDLNTYYKNSIDVILSYNQNAHFIVFTDDIKSLSKLYSWLPQRYAIYYEESAIACLYMMARCRMGGICSNSTFSWWGAWLNTNPVKRVIFPSQTYIDSTKPLLTMKGAMHVSII
jgi:hypothetical protein